jgi:predicted metalloprotease with PDZ domain
MRRLLLPFLLLVLSASASAQTVSYTVSIPKPTSSLLHVVMEIRGATGPSVDVAMPAWSPGAYSLHWAAKNVLGLTARDGAGRALAARMVDTSTWRVSPTAPELAVEYDVYLGASAVNDTHATINGPRALLYLVGRAPYPAAGPLTIAVDAPSGWAIATGLDTSQPGVFAAPDYDTLADAPIEVSPALEVVTFEDQGATYQIVIHADRHNYDTGKLRDDVRKVVAEQVRMMGGPPYGRYVFLFHGGNGGSGGLEHLNSTAISFNRYGANDTDRYRRFQFVIAHEFFHLWNVKRIRPQILGPFDYTRPQHTRNLYVSEGMTSYYASLSLARSGVWTRQEFYDDLSHNIQELQTQPGHLVTSAEMSSWLTWNRPDNSANVSISYYTKGQILGTLLDLELRARTGNRRSLDDVFRYLLAQNGLPKPGFKEDGGFQAAVETIARQGGAPGDFSDFFNRYVAGLDEIPYDSFLSHAGLELQIDRGTATRSIGVTTRTDGDHLLIDNVPTAGPGYDAGLMRGDVLVALDGERIVPSTFAARLNDRAAGARIELQVMRGDRLLAVPVTLGEDQPPTYKVVEDPASSADARALRDAWFKASEGI